MKRGIVWLLVGFVAFLISYGISSYANDYVMGSKIGFGMFARANRMQPYFTAANFIWYGAIVSMAAGGVMLIVDSSPNRQRESNVGSS